MSEISAANFENSMGSVNAVGQASAGVLIRQARELAGLHIGALAVSLKVPVKKLEALEGDRIDELPDLVFARALAATVCRILKVDPAPVLAALPQAMVVPARTDASSARTSFRNAGHGPQKSVFEKMSRPFMLMGVAFSVGALALILYPSIEPFFAESSASSNIGVASPPAVAEKIEVGAVQLSQSSEQKSRSAMIQNASIGTVGIAANGNTQPLLAVDETGLRSATEVSSLERIAGLEASGILTLSSRGLSWVEVIDANRVTQLRKTMAAAESLAVSGALPLSVTVGRADAVEIQVRGKTVDLATYTKDNVARFEVN